MTMAPWTARIFGALALYVLVALLPLPELLRPAILTLGSAALMIGGTGLLLGLASRRDRCLALFLLFVLAYWAVAFPVAINDSDDNSAYLLFAEDFFDDLRATLQSLSERRLFAVGGILAFQAPVIQWLGVRGLALVEPVFGLVLLLLPLYSLRVFPVPMLFAATTLTALFPMLGSAVLANTASTFILGALSLMLLFAAGKAWRQVDAPGPMTLFLLLALPLAAAVIRPTTVPFNAVVAGAALSALIVRQPGTLGPLAVLGLPLLVVFAGALFPYHEMGGSWLYPLFGHGAHITAEGISLTDAIGFGDHMRNLAGGVLLSPLSVAVLAAFVVAIGLAQLDRRGRADLAIALAAFLAFAALIIISTGGLAATRYISPVAFALLLFLLARIGDTIAPQIDALWAQSGRRFAPALLILAAVGLVGIRIAAPQIVAKRMKTIEPDATRVREYEAIARVLGAAAVGNKPVLLVGVADGRFIRKLLTVPVMVMDQPGMMVPWRLQDGGELLDYTTGLATYLQQRDVAAIVTQNLDCPVPDVRRLPGWQGVMQFGYARNAAALCALEVHAHVTRREMGRYSILLMEWNK